MKNLIFQSNLSLEEIDKNFENIDLTKALEESLQEVKNYKYGKAHPNTIERKRSLPNIDVASLRLKLNMTQREIAFILGVSIRTVESWESGRTNPTPTAKNLLFLINDNPLLINKLAMM